MRIEDFVRDFRMLELWEALFGFALDIDGDTEYARRADGTRCVLKGCLAYEITEENNLRLHFPRWDAPDGRSYDVAAVYGYAPPFCQRKL